MRISDWSSDVCSSDLEAGVAEHVLDVELPAVDLRRLLVHRHVDAEHRQRIARLAGDGAGRLPVLADAGLDHPRRTGIVVGDVCALAAAEVERALHAAVGAPTQGVSATYRRGQAGGGRV